LKIIIRIFLIFFCINAYSLEIIRDPVFENYFRELQLKYDLPVANVYIIEQNEINAFVLGNNIYFTTSMIKNVKDEDILKSIYFHEIGHIYHNHYNSKKIDINFNKKKGIYNNLFSIGAAIFTGNPNIGIATNLTINQSVLNTLSTNSIRFEIQADNYMIKKIIENKINTINLIKFFENLPENNNFFKSHPNNMDRVISLKKYTNFIKNKNSISFEWLKAKYGRNSNISELIIFLLR
jgi:predicted Zn-dependent protease